MPLADLLEPAPSRTPQLTCAKYMPGTDHRCVHYLPGGACARPDEFMCVEWLKANGHSLPSQAPASAPNAPGTPTAIDRAPTLDIEARIQVPGVGDIWLVPEHTASPRRELTPAHVEAIRCAIAAFPEGQLVSLERISRPWRWDKP